MEAGGVGANAKAAWWMCGGLALIATACFAGPAEEATDNAAPDWQKLLELPAPRGDEGNAFPRWLRAAEQMPKLSGAEEILLFERLASKERPDEDVLARAEAALAVREDALDAFVLGPGEFVELPRIRSVRDAAAGAMEFRQLARLKAARALLHAYRDRSDAAARCTAELMRIGADAAEDASSLVWYLTGLAVGGIGFNTAECQLALPTTGPAVCARLSAAMDGNSEAIMIGLENALRGEFVIQASIVDHLPETNDADALNLALSMLSLIDTSGETPPVVLGRLPQPLHDRAATHALLGRPLASFLLTTRAEGIWRQRAFFDAMEPFRRAFRDELPRLWRYAHTDSSVGIPEAERAALREELEKSANPFGRLSVMILTPSVDKIAAAAFRAEARRRCLALLCEMRHQLALGRRLPATVEELRSPNAPDRSLRDPFDGKLLRYDPARLRVWSVGPDGVDNGGEGDGGQGDSPDLAWALPVELLQSGEGR